ncbi:hypothetical protein MBANPS3_011831 [Mucor bainieri]
MKSVKTVHNSTTVTTTPSPKKKSSPLNPSLESTQAKSSSSTSKSANISSESIKRPFSSLSPPLLSIDSTSKLLKKKTISQPSRLPQPSGSPHYSSAIIDTQFTHNDTSVPPTFDQPMTNVQVDLDTSAPDWALHFQAQLRQLNNQLKMYDSRLASVENLAIENAKLRAELLDVKSALSEAQSLLSSQSSPATSASSSPSSPPLATGSSESASSAAKSGAIPSSSAPSQAATTTPAVSPLKPTAEFTVVKRKRKSKKPASPSPAALAAFSRKFSPTSDPSFSNGYRYVYYKAIKHRLTWYRTTLLPMIGVNDSRVLDIHFPTQRVAAFLLHSDFILDFTFIMHKKLRVLSKS